MDRLEGLNIITPVNVPTYLSLKGATEYQEDATTNSGTRSSTEIEA